MKLTAETLIKSDRETVWRLSQTPLLHARWDLRFTDIEYLPRESAAEPQRFRYATRIGFGLAVKGWGETIGDPERSTSALRFGSTDAKSIIREGTGSWTYSEQAGTVRFSTVYDYTIRHGWFGRVLDLLFRPLMIWATRWSFDRLRIWIEDGVQPETSFRLWLLIRALNTAYTFSASVPTAAMKPRARSMPTRLRISSLLASASTASEPSSIAVCSRAGSFSMTTNGTFWRRN